MTMLVAFVVYPVFVLQCYNRPLPRSWTGLLFLLTTTLIVRLWFSALSNFHGRILQALFSMISFEEAYHAYVHLCDNSAVLLHHWFFWIFEYPQDFIIEYSN